MNKLEAISVLVARHQLSDEDYADIRLPGADLKWLLLIANEARVLNGCVQDKAFGNMSKADIIRLLHVFLDRTRDTLAPLPEEERSE